MRRVGALALALGLAGCAQPGTGAGGFQSFLSRLFHKPPPPAVAALHYVIGPGYPAGGVWYYPREDFSYDMSGIATIHAGPHDPLTSDGEVFDAAAMAAAHQTLQLPALIRVTNLENGRQIALRVNDRGPADPGRILEVTPRAAQLLGFDADGTARVRMQVDSAASQALATDLHGGSLAIAAAPLDHIQADALAPPPGVRTSTHAARVATTSSVAPAPVDTATVVPLRLPETVMQTGAAPGTLWIEAGRFGRAEYANRRAAQIGSGLAQVGRVSSGGQTSYTVRIGPLDSVAQADAALAQVIRAGVSDARIEVE